MFRGTVKEMQRHAQALDELTSDPRWQKARFRSGDVTDVDALAQRLTVWRDRLVKETGSSPDPVKRQRGSAPPVAESDAPAPADDEQSVDDQAAEVLR